MRRSTRRQQNHVGGAEDKQKENDKRCDKVCSSLFKNKGDTDKEHFLTCPNYSKGTWYYTNKEIPYYTVNKDVNDLTEILDSDGNVLTRKTHEPIYGAYDGVNGEYVATPLLEPGMDQNENGWRARWDNKNPWRFNNILRYHKKEDLIVLMNVETGRAVEYRDAANKLRELRQQQKRKEEEKAAEERVKEAKKKALKATQIAEEAEKKFKDAQRKQDDLVEQEKVKKISEQNTNVKAKEDEVIPVEKTNLPTCEKYEVQIKKLKQERFEANERAKTAQAREIEVEKNATKELKGLRLQIETAEKKAEKAEKKAEKAEKEVEAALKKVKDSTRKSRVAATAVRKEAKETEKKLQEIVEKEKQVTQTSDMLDKREKELDEQEKNLKNSSVWGRMRRSNSRPKKFKQKANFPWQFPGKINSRGYIYIHTSVENRIPPMEVYGEWTKKDMEELDKEWMVVRDSVNPGQPVDPTNRGDQYAGENTKKIDVLYEKYARAFSGLSKNLMQPSEEVNYITESNAGRIFRRKCDRKSPIIIYAHGSIDESKETVKFIQLTTKYKVITLNHTNQCLLTPLDGAERALFTPILELYANGRSMFQDNDRDLVDCEPELDDEYRVKELDFNRIYGSLQNESNYLQSRNRFEWSPYLSTCGDIIPDTKIELCKENNNEKIDCRILGYGKEDGKDVYHSFKYEEQKNRQKTLHLSKLMEHFGKGTYIIITCRSIESIPEGKRFPITTTIDEANVRNSLSRQLSPSASGIGMYGRSTLNFERQKNPPPAKDRRLPPDPSSITPKYGSSPNTIELKNVPAPTPWFKDNLPTIDDLSSS